MYVSNYVKNLSAESKMLFLLIFAVIISVLLPFFFDYRLYTFDDSMRQTFVLTQYFKQYINETGDFFPQINMNMGLTQSFVYMFYYGFYSPITLIYYLWPFSSQLDFRSLSFMAIMIIHVILSYKILQGEAKNIYLFAIGIILMAFPAYIIYYFSYVDMFAHSYLPFLLLIYGTKRLLTENKPLLITIAIFLIFLINYTFILLYIFYTIVYVLYMVLKHKYPFRKITYDFIKFILYSLLGFLMSIFFVIPQVVETFGFRTDVEVTDVPLFFDLRNYHFTYFIFFLLPFSRKIYNYVVFISIMAISLFTPLIFILQVFQGYERKVQFGIPLILSFLVINLINEQLKKGNNKLIILAASSSILIPTLSFLTFDFAILTSISYFIIGYFIIFKFNKYFNLYFMITQIGYLISIFVYFWQHNSLDSYTIVAFVSQYAIHLVWIPILFFIFIFKNKYLAYLSLFIAVCFIFVSYPVYNANFSTSELDKNMTSSTTTIYDNLRQEKIKTNSYSEYYANTSQSFISQYTSLENQNYIEHFNTTLQIEKAHRLTFNKFIYSSYFTNGQYALDSDYYQTKPIFYISKELYNIKQYENLSARERLFYEYQGSFMNKSNNFIEENLSDYQIIEYEQLPLENEHLVSKEKENSNNVYKYDFGSAPSDGEFIVQFDFNTKTNSDDMYLEVVVSDGKYEDVLSLNNDSKFVETDTTSSLYLPYQKDEKLNLTISFNPHGYYDPNEVLLKDFNIYFVPKDQIENLEENYEHVSNFEVKLNHQYSFETNCDETCTIVSTIPYDDNYKVTVNGNEIEKEKVNLHFLAFEVENGKNEVVVSYHIPNYYLYLSISIFFTLLYIGIIIYKIKYHKHIYLN